jgi:hypothetical protein
MISVEEFLEKHIEGYLFKDIEAIIEYVPVKHPGAAAYPVVMSVCSGIEMLGVLTDGKSEEPYSSKRIVNYFGHYWKNYLSKVNPEYKKHNEIARALIRNGIAHAFATKPGIGITRQGNLLHLQIYKGQFVINANSFYEDFKQSYLKHAKPHIFGGGDLHDLAEQRLKEMLAVYEQEALTLFKHAKMLKNDTDIRAITYTPSINQIVSENSITTTPSGTTFAP